MSIDTIQRVNEALKGIVWGPPMLILIAGTGIYLSIGTGFIQAGKFGYMWKNTIKTLFKSDDSETETKSQNVTPFQAVTTALAGTVGVGNVAGVAGAIVSGGPGALFWMWVSAFLGMAVKYAEIVLAVHFRQTAEDSAFYGGPMYYIEKGLNMKWLALLFSVFGGLCCFGIGNAVQSAEIASAVNTLTASDASVATGAVLAVITAVSVVGGIKRIAAITSLLVPIMALFYLLGSVVILGSNLSEIPAAFALIFREAFSVNSAASGVSGYLLMNAVRYGFARGVFSNEAGLGSSPIAHASASAADPTIQGL